ncbi:MAG TPA: acetate--CoA ligase [Acidimicrobiia bacterium]|nr:acetate--CoA ligase [Acidimicrobiia bacterium]
METPYPPIEKTGPFRLPPNLPDYVRGRAGFTWDEAESFLTGLPGGKMNIAHEAIDRHADGDTGHRVAIRWLGRHGDVEDYTYAELAEATSRFASGLRNLGVGKGDRVFTLSSRIPELYIATLGALKNGSVAAPLFSAFGPEPIQTRLTMGEGRVLVTTETLYKRKVAAIRDQMPWLEHIIVVGGAVEGTISFDAMLKTGDPGFPAEPMDGEDMALLHFTSGTTGAPKGAVHVHRAVLHHYVSALYALDLHPGDIYWCTADPGWVTGTSYGIIAPLTHGVTSIVDEGEFDAERWYRTIEEQKVSVWYTAPTAVRMMMKAGRELAQESDLSSLRFVASVGEPLNPEAVIWGVDALGLPIHDNWWQTETGGIMVANYAAEEIRPGSMGRPLPGVEATILRRTETGSIRLNPDGTAEEESEPLTEGELALRPGWPSMFRGYLGMEERYEKSFVGGWYRTGDLAERDDDGYFWFVGRGDDVIKSAGHLIGPFEVESAMMEHPAVAEAGVIGKPDEVAGEVVKAFVSLNPGFTWSEELSKELLGWGRVKLGASVAPREIDFEPDLPHTRSGKIMRRLLKAWELGLPTGDLSTLEGQETE